MKNMILIILEVQIIFDLKIGLHGIKMIRSDFWFKYRIFFDEIPFGNDLNFSMKISFLAKRYEIITNRLYCLTYSSNSLTYKARSYELESLSLFFRLN